MFIVRLQRDLDGLTYSGAAINDLEVQLTRTKHLYQQVLVDGKLRVDMLRKKLHSNIVKSEPFIEIWRKARKVGASCFEQLGLNVFVNHRYKKCQTKLQHVLTKPIVSTLLLRK